MGSQSRMEETKEIISGEIVSEDVESEEEFEDVESVEFEEFKYLF